MPAIIVDLLVEVGSVVTQGETLLVLEAMKMQMKIKAPADGTVIQLEKQIGERVEKAIRS